MDEGFIRQHIYDKSSPMGTGMQFDLVDTDDRTDTAEPVSPGTTCDCSGIPELCYGFE